MKKVALWDGIVCTRHSRSLLLPDALRCCSCSNPHSVLPNRIRVWQAICGGCRARVAKRFG